MKCMVNTVSFPDLGLNEGLGIKFNVVGMSGLIAFFPAGPASCSLPGLRAQTLGGDMW